MMTIWLLCTVIKSGWGPSYDQLREVPKPNGVFTTKKEDGTNRYADISAVLFCHPYNTDSSKTYIHHNPFAKRPIGMEVFKGIPQCTIDLATGPSAVDISIVRSM